MTVVECTVLVSRVHTVVSYFPCYHHIQNGAPVVAVTEEVVHVQQILRRHNVVIILVDAIIVVTTALP